MSELLRHAMKSTKLASDAVRALERANARIVEMEAENARLRKLEHEYGRVEGAIIMNDKDFDGNSAHDNCGDRLIASVVRLRTRAEAAEAKLAAAYDAGFAASAEGWNGEYPGDYLDNSHYIECRNNDLREMIEALTPTNQP